MSQSNQKTGVILVVLMLAFAATVAVGRMMFVRASRNFVPPATEPASSPSTTQSAALQALIPVVMNEREIQRR